MTEAPVTSPLVQRLAVERLAAPGILDQRRLQRARDRFAVPLIAPMLGRLMRSVESTTPSAEGLLLARNHRTAEVDAQSPETLVTTRSVSASELPFSDAKARRGNASLFVSDRMARQAPGVTRAGEFVARAHAARPTLIDAGRTSSLVVARAIEAAGVFPSITRSTGANGLVQRVANSGGSSTASDTRSSPAGRSSFALSGGVRDMTPMALGRRVVMRKAESVAVAGATRDARDGAHQAEPRAMSATYEAGDVSTAAPLPWRKPGAAEPARASIGRPMSTAPSVVATTTTPLVFRKAVAAIPAFHPSKESSSIASTVTTSAPKGVVARMPAAPESTVGEAARTPTEVREAPMDIEWITQQVSSRLARRLEIERDRLGVRPWRQSSY